MAFNYTRGQVHHAADVRMWLLWLFQRAVMKKLTSASRIILFPSGQMTWSTWERTLSQVSSGVRRLACRGWQHQSHLRPFQSETFWWAFLVRLCVAAAAYHVDLRVWVAHVTHDGAVFHPVQLVSGHHVLVPCTETTISHLPSKIHGEAIERFLCMSAFLEEHGWKCSYQCTWWWHQPDGWPRSAWPLGIHPCWSECGRENGMKGYLTDDGFSWRTEVPGPWTQSLHTTAELLPDTVMLNRPTCAHFYLFWTQDWELVPLLMSLTRPARRRSGQSLSRTRWLPELSELHSSLSPPAKTKAALPHNKIRRN